MSSGVGDRIIKFLGLNKSNANQTNTTICSALNCQQIHDHQNGCPLQDRPNQSSKQDLTIEYELTADQKMDLCRKTGLTTRMKTIKELEGLVGSQRLVDYSVKYILNETMDLLDDNQPMDVRHSVWKFYKSLVCGPSDKLTDLRVLLWNLITNKNDSNDDILLRLDLLIALTNNGRDCQCFETKVCPFVTEWFDEVVIHCNRNVNQFLTFLVTLMKTNALYLDQTIVSDIISKTYQLMTNMKISVEELICCYHILDVIVFYSTIPSTKLSQIVIVLCKGVNNSVLTEICTKIMRNLLATPLGHSCVDTFRYLLSDETNYEDTALLRGAIHFVTLSLWDQTRNESLKHSPNSILPAFKSALECRHQSVAQEVSTSLICLFENQKRVMTDYTSDLILDIIDEIVLNYDICPQNPGQEFHLKFHRLLDIIEDLNERKQFFGQTFRLFDILEKCSLYRSEQSCLRLVQYRAQAISADKENWIELLRHLTETYFKREKRTFIRIEALSILNKFIRQHQYLHEEIIFESIIIPYLSHIELDSDMECRGKAVSLLVDMISDSISAKRCLEVLEIVERVCKRPFDMNTSAGNATNNPSDSDGTDIKTAIRGLISLFKTKLFTIPGLTAIQAFKILVSHLSAHYSCADYNSCVGQMGSAIKQEIFDLLLSIRANSRGQIGVFQRNTQKADNSEKYSVFIVCERNDMSPTASTAASPVISATTTPQTSNPLSPPPSPILHSVNSNSSNVWTLSFQDMFRVLNNCLRNEKDWIVLKLVLNALPKFFKNKAIIMSGMTNIAIDLCNALCFLISETNIKLIEFQSNEQKLTKGEFQSLVYPCLSAMVGYQNEIEFKQQCQIIKCLQNGLVLVSGKTSVLRQCILSLTICAVEMQEAMTKCLPETLLSLSKISATVPLSIPKLEFLSNVILLPRLYQSFTMDQYMSVFAIALPYTNPFKFNEYTVALAHRVIAMWFLKCRLPCRKSIVPFIIKGLQTNVMTEEMNHSNQYNDAQRLRSSSLNTDPSHKKLEARLSLQSSPPPLPSTPHSSHSHFSFSFSSDSIAQHNQHSPQQQLNNNSITETETELRHELVETCMDMLASYTFGMCSTVPLKSPMVEPLLDRSKSEHWIIGHKIITITTSGCGSRSVANGLCEKCLNVCRSHELNDNSVTEDNIQTNTYDVFQSSLETKSRSESTTSSDSDRQLRRRHQSEIGHILRAPTTKPQSSAFDDSYLNHNVNPKMSVFPTNPTTLCSCWCQGWAEIQIRRSTGVSSYIIRLQNSLGNFPYSSSPPDELPDFTALLRPNRTRESSVDPLESHPNHEIRRNSFDESDCVFNKDTPSPQIDNCVVNPLLNQLNGTEKKFSSKTFETQLSFPMRSTPSQPVTRAQSFGSRIRSEAMKTRIFERKENRSNDLESNEYSSQRYTLSRENSGEIGNKAKAHVLPLKDLNENMSGPRDRVHTISVMSPVNINRRFSKDVDNSYSLPKSSGLCPKFVFIQLYYNSVFAERSPEIHLKDYDLSDKTKPILLPKTDAIERSLKNLDRITPYETHKIGVLYVGPGQAKDKTAILSNPYGSLRYIQFLRGLGKMIRLEDADSQVTYVGGLDVNGQDGKYAISWEDSLIQVIFHVATLMPTKAETDPNCNLKKRHIGNDFVCIVYNESGSSVNISTIKGDGQCIQAIVVITPYEYNSNLVTIQAKDDFLNLIGHFDSQMLSDSALPVFVRQLALHANLGSMVYNGAHSGSSHTSLHVSNWVQRLKQIKRIRQRMTNKSSTDAFPRNVSNEVNEESSPIGLNGQTGDKSQYIFPDFNDYC